MRKYLKEGEYSYDQSQLLGKGSFGKVYKGFDHKNSLWVAIKLIDLAILENHADQMKTIICNQITVMRKFSKQMNEKPCPYLVKQYDCFRSEMFVYIIMEFCSGGTLLELLNKKSFHQGQVIEILEHLTNGLAYLDELNICHRDLKPQNIFVAHDFKDGKQHTFYKIGDFGFSAQKQHFNQVLGTYPYMAPEIFKRQTYTSKVDIWALGVIAYHLLFNKLYFMGKNKWQIQDKVKTLQFVISEDKKHKISKQMGQFISLCLRKDKETRPKAIQLLCSALFVKKNESVSYIFDALQQQLAYYSFLRSLAQELSTFGIALNRQTEFIQIYMLKKAYSGINYLIYSVQSKQNYLNVGQNVFSFMISENNQEKLEKITAQAQKQHILVTSLFQAKCSQFLKYIEKFSQQQIESIKSVISVQQIYKDINDPIFKGQLNKWIKVLQSQQQYEELFVQCQKLYEYV